MTLHTIHRTARPIVTRALDKLKEWDFYSDDHEEVKTLLFLMAMLVAVDGLIYVLHEVITKLI